MIQTNWFKNIVLYRANIRFYKTSAMKQYAHMATNITIQMYDKTQTNPPTNV